MQYLNEHRYEEAEVLLTFILSVDPAMERARKALEHTWAGKEARKFGAFFKPKKVSRQLVCVNRSKMADRCMGSWRRAPWQKRTPDQLSKESDQLRMLAQLRTSPVVPKEIGEPGIVVRGSRRTSQPVLVDTEWLHPKASYRKAPLHSELPVLLEPPAMVVKPEPQAREQESDMETDSLLHSGSVIDIRTPDGSRMRIRLEAGRSLDAVGLVAAFAGRGA